MYYSRRWICKLSRKSCQDFSPNIHVFVHHLPLPQAGQELQDDDDNLHLPQDARL